MHRETHDNQLTNIESSILMIIINYLLTIVSVACFSKTSVKVL